MTRVARLLSRIGWSSVTLGVALGVHERTPRAWASGRAVPPAAVEPWLERVAEAIERGPDGWDGDVRLGDGE